MPSFPERFDGQPVPYYSMTKNGHWRRGDDLGGEGKLARTDGGDVLPEFGRARRYRLQKGLDSRTA